MQRAKLFFKTVSSKANRAAGRVNRQRFTCVQQHLFLYGAMLWLFFFGVISPGWAAKPTGVSFSPGSLEFPRRLVNSTDRAPTNTSELTNSTPEAHDISFPVADLSPKPAEPSVNFSIPKNTCGTKLLPNSKCTITVEFNPTQVGNPLTGVVTVRSKQGTTLATLALKGTGYALNKITVTPSNPPPIKVNQTQQFTATGNYTDGGPSQDLTNSVAWKSDDTT
jgi:hypothetical protein